VAGMLLNPTYMASCPNHCFYLKRKSDERDQHPAKQLLNQLLDSLKLSKSSFTLSLVKPSRFL